MRVFVNTPYCFNSSPLITCCVGSLVFVTFGAITAVAFTLRNSRCYSGVKWCKLSKTIFYYPLESALAHRLSDDPIVESSKFPAAKPPDPNQPAKIETDYWPCPPSLAVVGKSRFCYVFR